MGTYTRSTDQKLIVAGHVLSTVGFFCFTLAKLTRLFLENDLPEQSVFSVPTNGSSREPCVEEVVEKNFRDNPDAFRW